MQDPRAPRVLAALAMRRTREFSVASMNYLFENFQAVLDACRHRVPLCPGGGDWAEIHWHVPRESPLIHPPVETDSNGFQTEVTPFRAIETDTSLVGNLILDLVVEYFVDGKRVHHSAETVDMGPIPLMSGTYAAGAGTAPYDPTIPHLGFILNGTCKTMVCEYGRRDNWVNNSEMTIDASPRRTVYGTFGTPPRPCRQVLVKFAKRENGYGAPIVVHASGIFSAMRSPTEFAGELNVAVAFLLLGVESQADMVELVSTGIAAEDTATRRLIADALFATMQGTDILSRAQAEQSLSEATGASRAGDMFRTGLFGHQDALPDLGPREAALLKARFLAGMVQRLVLFERGVYEADSKDSMSCHAILTPGTLMGRVVQESLGKLTELVRKKLATERKRRVREGGSGTDGGLTVEDAQKYILPILTLNNGDFAKNVRACLLSGKTDLRAPPSAAGAGSAGESFMTGTCAVNMSSLVSGTTRVQKTGSKCIKNRFPHLSNFGICPVSGKDGHQAGLSLQLSSGAFVSEQADASVVHAAVAACPDIVDAAREPLAFVGEWCVEVLVNGHIAGFTVRPREALAFLARLKRERSPMISVSFSWRYNRIYLATDHGRLCNYVVPLPLADPALSAEAISRMRLEELVHAGAITVLDTNELENAMLAPSIDEARPGVHTHALIHPSQMLGFTSLAANWIGHNQAPRNMYNDKQSRQAASTSLPHYARIASKECRELRYGGRTPNQTYFARKVCFANQFATKSVVIVAVTSSEGDNIEDATVIHPLAARNGYGEIYAYSAYATRSAKDSFTKEEQQYGVPDPEFRNPEWNYAKVDPVTGIPRRHVRLELGDVYTAMYVIDGQDKFRQIDRSHAISPDEARRWGDAYVHDVYNAPKRSSEARVVVCRRVAQGAGNKAAGSGQKGLSGVVFGPDGFPYTTGTIYSAETGMRPDLVFNHHGLPSRMTIGLLMEGMAAKLGIPTQLFADATAFEPAVAGEKVTSIQQGLAALGFRDCGRERMISTNNGRLIDMQVFSVPFDYMQLGQHIAAEKWQFRTIGHRHPRTKQPPAGKSRYGGLKTGEMEKDTYVAIGAAAFLQQVLSRSSDVTIANICRRCGMVAQGRRVNIGPARHVPYCAACRRYSGIARVEVPFAMLWLTWTLLPLNICLRMSVTD